MPDIQELRKDVLQARARFEKAKSDTAHKSEYDASFARLMKAINVFNEARARKIKELGLDPV